MLGLCLPRGASARHPAFSRSSTPMIDTLRPVPFASEMAISKTVAWLNEQLELGNERLLLMDCRPQELYESSHIESAINVAIPGIMLRRLQKGNLPVRALFTRCEDRDRFTRRCGTDTVVLYDENSSDWNENTGGESVLGLLLKKLKDEGCRAFYLEGMLCAPGARARDWGSGLRKLAARWRSPLALSLEELGQRGSFSF